MKSPAFLVVGLCGFFLTAPVNAAVVEISVVLDLQNGTIAGDPSAGPQFWFDDGMNVTPVAVGDGDQLRLNVEFASGQALEMTSGASGRQVIWATFESSEAQAGTLTTTVTDIDLLSGQANLPATSTTTFLTLTPGGQAMRYSGALTDSSILFTGFSTLTTYSSALTPFDFSDLKIMFEADALAVRPVPIPAAFGLFSVAPASLLPTRRRRKRT